MVLHHLLPWSIITSFSPQPSLDGIDWATVYRTLPLREAAARAGYDNELWRHCADHPRKDATWTPTDLDDLLARVDVPALHITGWYDLCQGTTLALYERFADECESPQQVIVGPWSHNGALRGPTDLSGVDFGPHSRLDMPEEIGDFFDTYLGRKGAVEEGGPSEKQHRVRVFLTGENRWLAAGEWPPARAEPLELLLSDTGLSFQAPTESGAASYTYDPWQPTPTRGGTVWEFPVAGLEPGPADQSPLHTRADLLVFASAPLSEPVTAVGRVSCLLYAETDGETTDFVAKLLDIEPDGTARLICDGIVRAHLWADPSIVQPVQPGAVVQYEVEMWSAGHTFRPGHRIALEVASASFPKWDRNSNTLSGGLRTARQRVHWGGTHPSILRLWVC